MRYRTVHALALVTLLLLATPLAAAGQPTLRGAGASAVHAGPASTLLGLLRSLWLGDEHHGEGGHGDPPPHHDPPPEGSGLCPHGNH
jgi:hypothetical protein